MMAVDGSLVPMPLVDVCRHLPDWKFDWFAYESLEPIADVGYLELALEGVAIEVTLGSVREPIDSSSMTLDHWRMFATAIQERYQEYDGFVIIHGTDTMAYTASALSFFCVGLDKPIVVTGAQRPVSEVDSDGQMNLSRALLTAAMSEIAEVVIVFGSSVLRGCRATKTSTTRDEAFISPNYPKLATFDPLTVNRSIAHLPASRIFQLEELCAEVEFCWFHSGIDIDRLCTQIRQSTARAMVLACYGDGHIPNNDALVQTLRAEGGKGRVFVAVSQCQHRSVITGRYAISHVHQQSGVVDGGDATFEATVTKLMWAVANCDSPVLIRQVMSENIRGERTV